ncbi:MAG: hypothetical protein KDA68_04260, partial [Planctomycetaceae bacterium]|nr:hypothetical protein [Planctomycetaceae bacterium]
MRVFKHQYKGRDGKPRELKVWYIEFQCHRDRLRRLPGFRDKGVTTELGRRIERLVSYRQMNMTPDPETCRWLEGLDDVTRERLQRFDLIDSRTASNAKLLSEHIADFEADLQNRGRTPSHYQAVLQRVRKTVEDCEFF